MRILIWQKKSAEITEMMAISFFIFLVIVNRHISVTAGQACSHDQREHNGSCYYFSQSKVNFDLSKSSCEVLGMHLVYIGSEEEQNFLENTLWETNEQHWIGLSKLTWLDGSSLTYNNFAAGYNVFNDKGTCFRMYRNTLWYDRDCSSTLLYICEKERGSSTACDSGQSEYEESCYFFSQSKSDFYSSKSSCEDLGMHLVYIGSQEEQEFLVDNRPDANSHYWIGLSSVTWLDGSSLTYANFAYNDSKTFDEEGSCFTIEKQSESFKWIDDNCADNHTHRYICEKAGGIQTSSVQHTTPGATMSTLGSTPNQVTSSGTSSSTTQTDVATMSGSTRHSTTAGGVVSETTNNPTSTRPEATSTSTTVGSTSNQMTSSATSSSTTQTDIGKSGSTQHSTTTTTTGGVVSETKNNGTSIRPTSEATSTSTAGQGSTASEQATDTTPAVMTKRATQTTTSSSPLEKEIQTSSVQHTKQRTTTSPDGSTETTPNQGTHSKTSIPSTRTEIQTSSLQHTKQRVTTSPDGLTETTPHMGTPSNPAIPTARKAYKKFKLVADNTALVDAYVRSSHTVFSLIGCSQRCFADTHCSCFIYIECEGLCLLGGECLAMSTDAYERRPGAKLYSAS